MFLRHTSCDPLHMRRLLSFSILFLALVGCTRLPELSSDEVLRRAARVSGDLESSVFSLDASTTTSPGTALTFDVEGVFQSGGDQVEAKGNIEGHIQQQNTRHAVQSTFETFIAWDEDVYLKISSLDIKPSYPLLSAEALEMFRDRWWRIPQTKAEAGSSRIAPDPGILRAQAEVVSVTRNLGGTTVNGRPAFHYAVALDRQKLLEYLAQVAGARGEEFDREGMQVLLEGIDATGELWIDAESFLMHRLTWEITKKDGAASSMTRVSLTFRDHNAAPVIAPPKGATDFSPLLFLEGSSPFPPLPGGSVPEGLDGRYDPLLQELEMDEQSAASLQGATHETVEDTAPSDSDDPSSR